MQTSCSSRSKVSVTSTVRTAAMTAAKRRNYLAWYSALLELWGVLRQPGMLDTITITDAMPPVAPWQNVELPF